MIEKLTCEPVVEDIEDTKVDNVPGSSTTLLQSVAIMFTLIFNILQKFSQRPHSLAYVVDLDGSNLPIILLFVANNNAPRLHHVSRGIVICQQ